MKPGSMTSGRALLIVLLAITCCSGMAAAFAQDNISTRKILVIHDSNTVGDWRREFDAALHSILRQHSSPGQRFSLSFEYTGINRYPEGQRPDAVINSLKAQHSLEPSHLVVAVLNQSAEFLRLYGDEIFPDIAKIYYASSELRAGAYQPLDIENNYYIQGDIGVPIAETLLLMPQLIPQLETINVISGV